MFKKKNLALFFLACFFVWWGSVNAVYSQSMKVEINEPTANQPPTARIEVWLKFTSAISQSNFSSTKVTVEGETRSLNGGGFPPTFNSGTVSEGELHFVNPTGGSSTKIGVARIDLTGSYKSGNKCMKSGNWGSSSSSAEYSISLNLPSGVSLDEYALTSYRAPSGEACSFAFRRNTNSNPGASFTSTPSVGTNVGRLPIDVALVLDRSGSMRHPAEPRSGSRSKITVLKEVANQFIDNWRTLMPNRDEDDLGVLFYESTVDPVTITGNTFLRRSSGGWTQFNSEINARSWAGRTAMGEGMQDAFSKLEGLVGDQDRAMIVLTDGKQNEGDEVHTCKYFKNHGHPNACGGDEDENPVYALKNDASEITTLPNRKTVIQTVYVGPDASVTAELMSGIARQNGGDIEMNGGTEVPLTAGDSSPNYGFLSSLEDVLRGYSPEVVLEEAGTVAARMDSAAHRFYVTRTATDVNLTLDWLNRDGTRTLNVTLYGPNNQIVEPDERIDREGYTVLSVDPSPYSAGPWTVRVTGEDTEEGEVEYFVTSIVEDADFSSELYFSESVYHTGDDIELKLQLVRNGTPVTEIDTVQANVFWASRGLGTILYQREEAEQQADLGEEVDRYTQKLYSLYKEQEVRDQISPSLRDSVQLVDTGQEESGDAADDDGIYSARLTDITTPGTYRFVVPLDFETEELGRIHRTKTIETTVEVKPTLEASEVSVGEGENTYLELIPKDPFGNYKGPGYGPQIQVSTAEGEPLDVGIMDRQTRGVYRIEFPQLSPDSDQPLQISVAGYDFEQASLAEISGNGGGLPRIILVVIGGLLALGLIVYFLGYRRSHV